MPNLIQFEVPGPPLAQKRHRTFRRGQGVGSYDPSASDKADFLALARDNAPERPIEGAVLLGLLFRMPLPKGAPKYIRKVVEATDKYAMSEYTISVLMDCLNEGPLSKVLHTKRPDVDNLVKLVKDALNGIYWKDDSQVQITAAIKVNSLRPRTEVLVRW